MRIVKHVALIREFDPWRSGLCTCPRKLTFNPYTGCDHACIYCYASSYVPRFTDCRPKKNLLDRLKREAAKLNGQIVSISNSSDPYPRIEREADLTRQCLQILSEANCRIQIITKSNLVTRDIDILQNTPSMVSVTITTENNSLAKLLEPNAPPPTERLKAIKTLTANSIPTAARIDPIIPTVNDNPERLVALLAEAGVRHLTCSTYKVKPDNLHRLTMVFPEAARALHPLYFDKGEKIGGYRYLPRELRLALLDDVRLLAAKYGVEFGTCREGLSHLNTAACDGSWLIRG